MKNEKMKNEKKWKNEKMKNEKMKNWKMKNEKMKKWKNEKMKKWKMILSGREKNQICFAVHFFICKANLLFTPPFFHFGVSNCFVIAKEKFQKKFHYSRIKLIIQTQIWKIWLICFLFFVAFFRVLDTRLTLRTCNWHVTKKLCKKYGWRSDSVPRNLGNVPIPRTSPWHVWDISN